jgi:murein DD-endopeptidase MepM/ murein hydrolase activator NlpD
VPIRGGYYGEGEQLTVPPETIDPANTAPEDEKIQAATEPVTPDRLWNGVFIAPSVGAYRSFYGVPRSYNGSPFDYYHSGLDFSGTEDRPITAPAPGVVVFAEALTVRGNATLIDHGWGVYTGYWHQSSFQVQVGDRVETGQIIGYQGNTGRVTGPHLHWEVWVGGVPVDPEQWLATVFP